MPDALPDVKPASVDAVLDEFNGKKDLLTVFCAKTKSLIEECLEDAHIRYQSVQARVKSSRKLRAKYSNPEKHYKRLDDITDLVGLRIITYYLDEVDLAADIIRREFAIDSRNSIDKRTEATDRFGYYAINYICRHSTDRLASVEYKRFAGVCCEIQITSILRHAWAEIEHEWYDLKDTYPLDIKRRFSRMAALLEVAESEFFDIRKKRSDYQRSVAVQVEAKLSGVLLEAVSIKSFIEQDSVVARIDARIASSLATVISDQFSDSALYAMAKAATYADLKTIEDLRSSLRTHEEAIVEFVALCRPYWPRASGGILPRGTCIIQLAVMLLGKRGEEQLQMTFRELEVDSAVNITAVATFANTVTSKYSK